MRSSRRRKQILLLLGVVGFFVALELYFRHVHEPGLPLARYLFASAVKEARWSFLSAREGELLVDESPERKRSTVLDVPPEEGRPPFDGVRFGYHVETNEEGFRERPFRTRPAGVHRIVLLGDSVSFGKGMAPEQRYSERLAASLPNDVEILNLSLQGCTSSCMEEVLADFVSLQPDLLVLQASANDLDRSQWRIAEESPGFLRSPTLYRLLTSSRALLTLAWMLAGDPFPESRARALAAMRERYGEPIGELFARARAANAEVVVLLVPSADDEDYGVLLEEGCGAATDVCLGVLRVDFRDHGALDETERAHLAAAREARDWVTDSAELANLPEGLLDQMMVHRHFFHDLVHPSPLGHAVIAIQLERLLRARWAPLRGREGAP